MPVKFTFAKINKPPFLLSPFLLAQRYSSFFRSSKASSMNRFHSSNVLRWLIILLDVYNVFYCHFVAWYSVQLSILRWLRRLCNFLEISAFVFLFLKIGRVRNRLILFGPKCCVYFFWSWWTKNLLFLAFHIDFHTICHKYYQTQCIMRFVGFLRY